MRSTPASRGCFATEWEGQPSEFEDFEFPRLTATSQMSSGITICALDVFAFCSVNAASDAICIVPQTTFLAKGRGNDIIARCHDLLTISESGSMKNDIVSHITSANCKLKCRMWIMLWHTRDDSSYIFLTLAFPSFDLREDKRIARPSRKRMKQLPNRLYFLSLTIISLSLAQSFNPESLLRVVARGTWLAF